jgi:daunorubicin resistance ABC transporter ATP-binding subunit
VYDVDYLTTGKENIGMTEPMIEAEALRKRFGSTQALDGLDLQVGAGQILGVLGPNGAGKTTAVRVLTTLSQPDQGHARVAGFDVVTQADAVRRSIGVTAQGATVDEALSGRQNLVMIGRLSGLSRRAARTRAVELLDQFELTDAADRPLKGYSGGMRRRLDLAAGLVTRPPVLFLDEPTTGLDPTSRARMWGVIRALVADGATLLLTTQYLDEADQLADEIVVIDHGRAIARGTAAQLKDQTGGATLHISLPEPATGTALGALAALVAGEIKLGAGDHHLTAPVAPRPGLATDVVRALDQAGITVDDVELHRPALDDVFFALTADDAGHVADHEPEELLV